MRYIGLIAWMLFIGICVYGFPWLLYIILLPIGAFALSMLWFVIKAGIKYYYYGWMKKHNPSEYRDLQEHNIYASARLREAERAKTEEERQQKLREAELWLLD